MNAIAKAKGNVPGGLVFEFECDLRDGSNPVKMREMGGQEQETFKMAKDCGQSREGFRLICVAELAAIAGVNLGVWMEVPETTPCQLD